MEEFELGVEEVVAPENVYDTIVVPSTKNQKNSLVVDETAKAMARGEDDIPTAIKGVASKPVSEVKAEAANRHVERTKAEGAGVVEEVAITAPEALPEVVTKVQASIQEAGATILAREYDWVENVSQDSPLTKEEKLSVAVNMGLLQHFAKAIDETSVMGLVPDFMGSMFVPDSYYNVASIDAGIRDDKTAVKDVLASPATISKMKGFRNDLSVEERVVFDREVLIPLIERITDNKFKRAELANVFTGLTDEETAQFFIGLDMADSTLILSQVATMAFQVAKGVNSLRKLSKLKKTLAARQIAEVVTEKVDKGDLVDVSDDTVAKTVGIHQTDAAVVGNPLVPEGVFQGAPEGTQGKYRNYLTKVEEHLQRARDSLNVTLNPTKAEELEIAASVEKRLKKDYDLENFKYTKTDTGLNFTFDKYDGDDLVESGVSVDFELKDLGGLQQPEGMALPPVARHILSPLFQAGADAFTFSKSAAGVMFATERARNQFGKALGAALSPIKGLTKSNKSFVKSANKIDTVMRTLENTDEIPTYHKLVNQGVNGIKLNEKEFQAYTGMRKVIDDLWWDNNDALRREWMIKGVKSISGGDRSWFAKELKDASAATNGYGGGTVGVMKNGVITHTKGSLAAEEIAQLYDEGQVLVKSWSTNSTEWFKTPGDGVAEYAIVNKLDVEELPRQVLGRVPNYVPRVHEDANWFLKKKEKVNINGREQVINKAIAFGSTRAQVEKHLDDFIEKTARENPDSVELNRDDYGVFFDREQVSDSSSLESISLGGGLVKGHRSSSPLVYAGTDSGKQTNVVDSIQSYLSVTADRVNMNEWRAEARHRIVEEVASYPELAQSARGGSWSGLKGLIQGSNIPSARKNKLLTMYDQTDSMSRIPTHLEKEFQEFTIEVGKRFDKKDGNKITQGIAKFMYKWSDENPTNIAKSWTFNTVLGMFNPAQIITQASGISAAYSIHPIHALAATPRWILAGALDMTTNEKAAEGFLGMFARKANVDSKTLKKDYQFWKKSGMYDSVIAGNADAAALKLGLPYDAGLLRRTLTGVVEKGRIPFNIGEVANMRISFFTALEREKKLNKNFSYSDDDLVKVLGRAEDLRLNMSSANKSNVQKGFLGLPTQFLNIMKATAETAISKNLTVEEKGRFWVGQITLYGTAGIPLVGAAVDHILEASNVRPSRVDGDGGVTSEELNTLKNGTVGKGLAGLGIESGVANKLTLASDIYDTIVDNFVGDEAKVQKAMFGASYRTGDRVHDIVMNTLMLGRVSLENLLAEDGDPEEVKLVALMLAKSLVDLPSSSRQIQAALDLNEGLVKRSDGTPLLFVNPEIGEVYATAVGIPLDEINDRYKVSREERALLQEERDVAARIISLMYTMEHGLMGQDVSFSPGAVHKAATLLTERMSNNGGGERTKRVMDIVRNKMKNPKSWQEKSTEAIIRRAADGTATAVMNLDVTTQRIIERGNK
jgi:hypothetical protein